jgi:hypothetical protein
MGDQQHDPIDLAVDVRSPVRRAVETGTVLGDHALEVADDLIGL